MSYAKLGIISSSKVENITTVKVESKLRGLTPPLFLEVVQWTKQLDGTESSTKAGKPRLVFAFQYTQRHALSARVQGWLILQSRRGVSKSQIAHTVGAMVILNRRGGGARCAGRRLTYV